MATLEGGASVAPFSSIHPDFTLAQAYAVAALVRARREAQGARVVGRKIGFTNRTIWDEYGVHAPIWGWVYDCTLIDLAAAPSAVPLVGFVEPRIEPEIAFGLKTAPEPGMDAEALLGCIGWVAHGFEIVQSIFPGWRFAPADTVAAFGLHGALLLGPRVSLATGTNWREQLASFTITLSRDGVVVDHGRAANVLDGPLMALKHLLETLAGDPGGPPLEAGEIVTTGTLTRAWPVSPGETWSTSLDGLTLPGLSVGFV